MNFRQSKLHSPKLYFGIGSLKYVWTRWFWNLDHRKRKKEVASEVGLVTDIFPLISLTCDWLAVSFLNPDWFTKLARPILVTDHLSRQPKPLLSFLFYVKK